MQLASTLACDSDLGEATRQAVAQVKTRIGRVDAAFAFVSPAFGDGLAGFPALLEDAFPEAALRVGCTGAGLIGGGREIESKPGVSITAAAWPSVRIHGGHLTAPDLPGPDAPPGAWAGALRIPRTADLRGILVLADPFHFPIQDLLLGLDYAWAGVPKVGGIASGSRHPDGHRLFYGRTSARAGALVLGLEGDLRLDAFVAQGCRPIGQPGTVSAAEASQLLQISGRPALEFLHETLLALDDDDQQKARSGNLFLGLAHDPLDLQAPGPGQYLIRHLTGIQPEVGSLTVGARPTVGSTVQFHLRDRDASAADLRAVLAPLAEQPSPAGALMFSCLGRGEHLYGEPDHDSRVFTELSGAHALGGFFCNGEIGPVGAQSHLHGFTASFAVFRSL